MATRIVFTTDITSKDTYYNEELVDFKYYSGFAASQKQKSIGSLHASYQKENPSAKILEVSSKSEIELGTKLSAFNLLFTDERTGEQYNIENVFQSSKVYSCGGPYRDLLQVLPKDAKRDERHKNSGSLLYFEWDGWHCPLEPKTMFYDWIYCKALSQNPVLIKDVIDGDYDSFTDIEFNQNKSINCQARAAAIFVSLYRRGLLSEFINDKEKWAAIYNG